ncbi:hypothetical protein RSAG8_10190, partial [Rhizoctonia solani AG-8 WAC10335]
MSDGQPEGNTNAQQSDNDPISIKVVTSTGEEVYFKIKRGTKLKKLQGAYAAKVGKDSGYGKRRHDNNTMMVMIFNVALVEMPPVIPVGPVDWDTKIKEVKQLYKDKTGLYPDILEYHDNALQDDRTLGEYGVEEYGDPIIVKGN